MSKQPDHEPSKLETAREFLKDLKDIENSQTALIEKMATLQLQADEAGFEKLVEALGVPFGSASKNAEALTALVHDMELEVNKMKNEAS